MITSLFKHFNPDTTVLTPNQRLTAYLFKKYNAYQQEKGERCWPSVDLLPFSSWVQRLWDSDASASMDNPDLVLNTDQELILWEEIISKAPESEYLLKLSELAKQAKSAWSTLKKWRTDISHPSFALTENSCAFQRWAQQFATRCQQEHWIDSASLTDLIIEKIHHQCLPLPRQLLLVNFAEITPQQHELFKACETRGTKIIDHQLTAPSAVVPRAGAESRDNRDDFANFLDPADKPRDGVPFTDKSRDNNARLIALNDEEQEIQTVACWAKKILDQQPTATIGCIASSLEEKRDTIISIFTAVFASDTFFNISAGKTLASYPIIQNALQLLLLPLKNAPIETLSFILHTPFLGDAEKEMLQRIQADSWLRKQNITALSWEALWKLPPMQSCSHLTARLKAFLQQREEQQGLQAISLWVHHFATALETLGWPGEQSLNSAEYQVVHCWLSLLKETAALDSILPNVNYNKALHYLTILAAQTFFQPQTPEAPIQILGQLEGAGIPFDYLWVMGMDDKAWPPAPKPSPFIPHDLQKRLQMPNASAARQLDYSLTLTKQFKQTAQTVIFSYAQHQGQEALRASPLLADLSPENDDSLAIAPFSSTIQQIFATQTLESIQDEQALALMPEDKIQGGASIFEMQAACPFKAFASLRLHARTIEEAELGLPAKNRGTIVHRVLELFWQEMGDQASLLQLSNQDLQCKIKQYLTSALAECAPFLQPGSLYLTLVTERLSKLLEDWLVLEKSRPPFTVIAQEQEKTLKINNTALQLRVDRIDELADGTKLIIDYKTKKQCHTQDWFGERPEAPQLPLYCISDPGFAQGLAFAQLHSSQIQWKGLAQKDLGIPGIKTLDEKSKADATTWEEQLEQWRITLAQLLHDFQSGHAAVDPKEKQTCGYCDLQTFCRVYE